MRKKDLVKKDIVDIENEKRLHDIIIANVAQRKFYYEWSNKSPYYAEINGETIRYENSYVAHLEKHPKNEEEKFIWKNQLSDFPDDIEKNYLKYSQGMIANYPLSFKYDTKNHSMNFDIQVEVENGQYETIRTSLKKSPMSKDKLVITTCHPRRRNETSLENYYFQLNKNRYQNYCYLKNINIINKPNILQNLFIYPMDGYNEQPNELKRVIKRYLTAASEEIQYLEYYKNKYEDFELTDLFDYNKVRDNIDNLFICKRYYELKYDRYGLDETENFCDILIKRFQKIDDYDHVQNYIKLNYKHSFDKFCFETGRKLKNELTTSCLKELISKYHREDNDYIAKGKSYQIDVAKFRAAKSTSKVDCLTTKEIFVFGKWNHISYDDINELLCMSNNNFPLPFLKEKGFNIVEEWDVKYDDEKMQEIVDIIDEYFS